MRSKITPAVILLIFTTMLSGCDDARAPSAPEGVASTPPPPSGSDAREIIRGSVSDTALRRIAGARVELLDGPQAGASALTNASGEFSMLATVDDTTKFRASRDGHAAADVVVQQRCAQCNPKRWVHFYLNVLEPPVALAGDYTVTVKAGSACTNLPEALRTRSYEATVAPGDIGWVSNESNAPTALKVTPKGSGFPGGLNNFWLGVAGNHVALLLGDHTDPGVTERLGEHSYWAAGGVATVTVESKTAAISTRFQGWIESCVNPEMGERYDCTTWDPTVVHARCESTDHQLTLTRR